MEQEFVSGQNIFLYHAPYCHAESWAGSKLLDPFAG